MAYCTIEILSPGTRIYEKESSLGSASRINIFLFFFKNHPLLKTKTWSKNTNKIINKLVIICTLILWCKVDSSLNKCHFFGVGHPL